MTKMLSPLAPKQDTNRLLIAIVLVMVIMGVYQVFIEGPRREKYRVWQEEQKKVEALKEQQTAEKIAKKDHSIALPNKPETRQEALQSAPRLPIESATLKGSLSLKGLRIDDMRLENYRETLDGTDHVLLMHPAGLEGAYFVDLGWLPSDGVATPTADTLWKTDAKALTQQTPATLYWENGSGVRFEVLLTLDEHYMMHVTQRVINRGTTPASVTPYAFINRQYDDTGKHMFILHEGPIGSFDGTLKEISYSSLRKEGDQSFADAHGWAGISDKYWLAALVPDAAQPFAGKVSYYQSKTKDRYQVEATLPAQKIEAGETAETKLRVFIGAKELNVLDDYASGDPKTGDAPIPLFDRAVDLGYLYFLTKPMFELLTTFYGYVGNFGIAIMMLTVVVKLAMFPLANKSFHTMSAMRELQPEMAKLKDRHPEDKVRFQKEVMELYKRERVNPASGCLPILIQMPVFFALYKVLYVTIEMRHAPFYGWIRDLSGPDSSNLFTLFGLVPWTPPHLLHLGVLPILMCISMAIQMRLQPKPADPAQEMMLKYMPFLFIIIFAGMPAGLLIYWTWSNTLSILQQLVIRKRYKIAKARKAAIAR